MGGPTIYSHTHPRVGKGARLLKEEKKAAKMSYDTTRQMHVYGGKRASVILIGSNCVANDSS